MFLKVSKFPEQALAGIGLGSLAAVAFALVAQHGFGVKPCPWCVMQRGIFLLIAAVALLGWLFKRQRPLRTASLAALLVLALAGLASAYYQHEVAALMDTCKLTFAETVLEALDLEMRWPFVFMVTATCKEAAAYRLLGLPYEIWSGLSFLLIGGLSLLALSKKTQR